MFKAVDKEKNRRARHSRIRKKVSGTSDIPRLMVYKSNKNIYAQIIDDDKGETICSASTLESDLKDLESTSNVEAAKKVGEKIGQKATSQGIKAVVFDRGGYKYHGKVKALADAAREAGLDF